MQYFVEYIDPEIATQEGFPASGRVFPYCYVEADSESAAIAAASGAGIPTLDVTNATATVLCEEKGETLDAAELAREISLGWRHC